MGWPRYQDILLIRSQSQQCLSKQTYTVKREVVEGGGGLKYEVCAMRSALYYGCNKRGKRASRGASTYIWGIINTEAAQSEHRANISFCPKKGIFCKSYETFFSSFILFYSSQRVTRRCRLSWLTNSPNAWGWGGGLRDLSQWIQLCTWSPNKLRRSNSIFNLWFKWNY